MLFNTLFRKKIISEDSPGNDGMNGPVMIRNLGVRDLTFLGIAAIIGAGIFSTIGNASFNGGPAVSLLFIFTAVACAFSAMCYAQFASSVPLSGSAYTYAYVSFGELAAWIIGWTLIVEYAIGNIAVAISWSDYFTGLVQGTMGLQIPSWLTMDYLSASRGYQEIMQTGSTISSQPVFLQDAYMAWNDAPKVFGLRLIMDLPALIVVFLITALVYRGIHESKTVSNFFVYLKLGVITLVILAGAFYVNPQNWSPFAPNGIQGVLQGVSSVFFAYIGFDALSSTAEECKNPRKDLPRSMLLSLGICTLLYIFITLILTGMVSYKELSLGDPLSFVFEKNGVHWISGIVAGSAIIAMASVLLVFQIGQPRIWMSMGRDGLLPHRFARLHKQYRTPAFSTVITGILVAVPALFMNLKEVTDLASIGTLFAFIVVCAGVLKMDNNNKVKGSFRVPYINSRYTLPAIWILILSIIFQLNPVIIPDFISSLFSRDNIAEKIPVFSFLILSIFLTIQSSRNNYSLIPVLGILTNSFLMTELGISNWIFFIVWLLIGLVVYFTYGIRHSKCR